MALLFSNTVLAHVPLRDIRRLFTEAFRLLQPDGLMVHFLNLSDHFAHADHSISPLNCLTFSEAECATYTTGFCSQNRRRVPSYRQLIEDAGFAVLQWDVSVQARLLQQWPHLNIHRDFAELAPEELCATSLCVVARRP